MRPGLVFVVTMLLSLHPPGQSLHCHSGRIRRICGVTIKRKYHMEKEKCWSKGESARKNGFAAGKAEVARTMLTMGLSDEVILQATGLSEAELAGLKEDIQPS